MSVQSPRKAHIGMYLLSMLSEDITKKTVAQLLCIFSVFLKYSVVSVTFKKHRILTHLSLLNIQMNLDTTTDSSQSVSSVNTQKTHTHTHKQLSSQAHAH